MGEKPPKRKSDLVPWREGMKEHLEKHDEPGIILRASRYKAAMTQIELAKAIDISQHHISEMENGKRPIEKIIAKRLGKVFKCTYRVFLQKKLQNKKWPIVQKRQSEL
ncbi:MAG: helix-turn-helix transcriptional regulator [Parachlamydiales bacterium]|nr:helix-turn-helix transcriptional regulator [Verrucomicrobiota bacterium]MBX3718807.1 helix-turn-helix transcriptional regulator [Candidatus Acheromyda pituitae]